MENIQIGKYIQQPNDYRAFIPNNFPVPEMLKIPQELLNKAVLAERLLGKLDGVTQTLPDIDFFIRMFSYKDATNSSQIEGTQATMADALELSVKINDKETDANDIIFYIKALDYGLKKIQEIPLSLRFIKEIHKELMYGARSTHYSAPGEFRASQNWLGGVTIKQASFIPIPHDQMYEKLSDLEKFLHNKTLTLPIINIAYSHAQFETIHPFLDGNGRVGRLLITFLLQYNKTLEKPVLFLSSFFKKHQKLYYQKLNNYHNGEVFEWLEFFLDGVIETAKESIEISQNVRKIKEKDMTKIQLLGKRESKSTMKVLFYLFSNPIITNSKIAEVTNLSRQGSVNMSNRLKELGILNEIPSKTNYDKKYIYTEYFNTFV
ncbi:Fic family protein [Patescibacteria group bacterium]|nr:Fic family protein [Patescibacteria group bacterium]